MHYADDSVMMSVYDIVENTIKGGSWLFLIIGNADLKLLTTVCNLSASGKWTLFTVYYYPVKNN